jgi:hypothetical protein
MGGARMQTRLGRFLRCALTLSVVAWLASCGAAPESSSSTSSTPTASPSSPGSTASPTPSAEELHLRKAEEAVIRFWRVIDRLSADPESDLTRLTTVARGSVAAQWARNINQYRFDQVKAEGRVTVRDATARESKDENFYKVTACIDASNINLVDKSGKSVVPLRGPRRVSYDYTVEKDKQQWYVIKEKVTKTC